MTVEDIYTHVSSHMVKGLMIHSQLADYYYFLNLEGYACCHEYHFLAESETYRKFMAHYIKYHHELIPETEIENPDVIPTSWYKYTSMDLDASTVKTAVQNGLKKWVDWEKETKVLYETMYKELLDIGAVSDTIVLKELIEDVSCELRKAEKYQLNKELINYDISTIISEQKTKKDKYKHKIDEIRR